MTSSQPTISTLLYTALPTSTLHIRLLRINSTHHSDSDQDEDKDHDEPISCTLSTHLHAAAPKYHCLSYVWGNPEQHQITLNGHSITVTKNLHGFLRRFRIESDATDAFLWIDALCINQQDVPERTDQVRAMGRIYAEAEKVIAWLGWEWDRMGDASDQGFNDQTPELEASSEAAVGYVRKIAAGVRGWVARGESVWGGELGRHAFDALEVYELLGIEPVPMKLWKAVAVLLDRAWFRRAWIVQEAALAKKLVLVVGSEVLAWADVLATADFLQASGWFLMLSQMMRPTGLSLPVGYRPLLFASLQAACRLEEPRAELHSVVKVPTGIFETMPPPSISNAQAYDFLARLIGIARPFEASDPRDKIFAPLVLVRQVSTSYDVQLPEPDYSQPIERVLEAITADILEQSSDLYILSHLGDGLLKPGATSWIPNYTQQWHSAFRDVPHLAYNALPGRVKKCSVNREQHTICMSGFHFDTVKAVHSLEPLFVTRDMRPVIDFCLHHVPVTVAGKDRVEAFWRTLVGNSSNDQSMLPCSPEMAACLKRNIELSVAIERYGNKQRASIPAVSDWAAWGVHDQLLATSPVAAAQAIPSTGELAAFAERWRLLMMGDVSKVAEAKRVAGPSDKFAMAAGRVCGIRALFVTENGNLGLCPGWAVEGDVLWFLEGAPSPFVLRGVGDESGEYAILGEAYLHGHMMGEVLQRLPSPVFRDVVIR